MVRYKRRTNVVRDHKTWYVGSATQLYHAGLKLTALIEIVLSLSSSLIE